MMIPDHTTRAGRNPGLQTSARETTLLRAVNVERKLAQTNVWYSLSELDGMLVNVRVGRIQQPIFTTNMLISFVFVMLLIGFKFHFIISWALQHFCSFSKFAASRSANKILKSLENDKVEKNTKVTFRSFPFLVPMKATE